MTIRINERGRLRFEPRGEFSLAASARFLGGFAPATSLDTGSDGRPLTLAFPVEGEWTTPAAAVSQRDATVTADVVGDADHQAATAQLARIFSLDIDGTEFPEVGRRDPVAGELQRRYPGLRPVCFWSPYEAACWAVIGQRIRIVQAAAVKRRLAETLGETVEVAGRPIAAFPSPQRLREISHFPGIPPRKISYLREIADAARAGLLDGHRLRSLSHEAALDDLRQLPGIGPFSAELVLVRGAGAPDVFPIHERRLRAEMTRRYELEQATDDQFSGIAESWRPYRSWVALLLRTRREDTTHEIGGARTPGRPA